MKTETEIAKDNVRSLKDTEGSSNILTTILRTEMKSHLQSCQRFLWYLQAPMSNFMNLNGKCFRIMNNKIKDLQNAIKIYEDAGIKWTN